MDGIPIQSRDKEEQAIVLDFLPNGYPFDPRPSHRKTPIVQALGKRRFTLLELVPKKDIFLQPNHEVYIGEGKRDQIHHILGKLPYSKLTSTGRANLEYCIKDIVKANEANFVVFFNKAQPMTVRMHQLELIPGVGKKHMNAIIEEREKSEFKSFEDLKSRVKLMPDPEGAIVKRILNELEGIEKHRIFTSE
jgi:putative nucleotide binding protein